MVDFRLAPPEIVHVINDAQARILFVGPGFVGPEFVGPEFVGAVAQLRDELPTVEQVTHVGGDMDGYEAWIAAHEPDTDVHPAASGGCVVQPCTSGTTGFPRGTMLTHSAMLAHATNVRADFDVDGDSRAQVAMPLFHVGGTSSALLAIAAGAHIRMMRLPDPAGACEMLERERHTRSACPR